MNIVTKTALAAVLLAATVASANAQQGQTRQIQVLPAPGAVQGQAVALKAPIEEPKPEIIAAPAPAPEVVAPKPEIIAAPAPAPEPKLVVAPKPEPQFVAPIIEKPVRKAYGYYSGGYRAPHCH
jgi:hypothetical protein